MYGSRSGFSGKMVVQNGSRALGFAFWFEQFSTRTAQKTKPGNFETTPGMPCSPKRS